MTWKVQTSRKCSAGNLVKINVRACWLSLSMVNATRAEVGRATVEQKPVLYIAYLCKMHCRKLKEIKNYFWRKLHCSESCLRISTSEGCSYSVVKQSQLLIGWLKERSAAGTLRCVRREVIFKPRVIFEVVVDVGPPNSRLTDDNIPNNLKAARNKGVYQRGSRALELAGSVPHSVHTTRLTPKPHIRPHSHRMRDTTRNIMQANGTCCHQWSHCTQAGFAFEFACGSRLLCFFPLNIERIRIPRCFQRKRHLDESDFFLKSKEKVAFFSEETKKNNNTCFSLSP